MRRLGGKTALITGCNRGIGRAILVEFAQNGANIICGNRSGSEEFNDFISLLSKENNVSIEVIHIDLSEEENIKSAFKELNKQKKSIDILVNNAGMPHGGLMMFTPISKIKEVFQVNFFSPILVTQLAVKIMTKQKSGVIINMSSVTALDNQSGWTAYGSSKGALISFTRTIARELAPLGIRVNAVAPGLIETQMGGEMDEKSQNEMLSRSSMHRKGTPEEVASLITFLASEEASYITGQTIRIDGGM